MTVASEAASQNKGFVTSDLQEILFFLELVRTTAQELKIFKVEINIYV